MGLLLIEGLMFNSNFSNNMDTMEREANNTIKIVLGFLAGAAAGAVAGILLAPDKGTNTRKNISDKATQFRDNANERIQNGVTRLNSLKESAFTLINKYGEEKNQPQGQQQQNY